METLGRMPILNAVWRHIASERASFHVPGHHQGRNLPFALANWLGQAAKLDVTELPGLDNLHHAKECILESQNLAASFYGSDACFYSVNGATACVMAAIDACVRATKRRRILCLEPCHVSVWRGLVYADAEPVYYRTKWQSDSQTFAVPTAQELAQLLEDNKGIAAVFVTSPNYQGYAANVAELAAVAHGYEVPLIVDEAHGAHFGLHPSFPIHSIAANADIVIQSPHKTLPCMTQAAWVHVKSTRVPAAYVRQSLLFLQTTSPSYILLSSLDAAQAWLWTEGQTVAHRTMKVLSEYRSDLNPMQDPMRQWIPTASEAGSRALEERFIEQGLFVEYADATGLLAIFGFHQPESEFRRFFDVYAKWRDELPNRPDESPRNRDASEEWSGSSEQVIHLDLTPRQVAYADRQLVHLAGAVNRFAAEPLVPYPPGAPLVWPGQRITEDHVELLSRAIQNELTVIGVDEQGFVEVINA